MGIYSAVSGAAVGSKMAGVAVVALVLGAAAGGVALASSRDQDRATVVRVIDGDTLVASVDGTEQTVRLLNVDTPETKHPNKPVECLGPEATAYLQKRLPVGTAVTLEYDRERLDRYGRTLAGVFESNSLVNADIAAEGLGVAVLFEPNRRFYDDVLEAQQTATARPVGFNDPAVPCTLPGRVASAVAPLEALAAESPVAIAEAAASVATGVAALAAADAALKSARSAAHLGGTAMRSAYAPAQVTAHSAVLTGAIAAGAGELRRLEGIVSRLEAAEARAAAEAKRKEEVAKKKAATKKAAAEKVAAAKAAAAKEAERQAKAAAARADAARRAEAARQDAQRSVPAPARKPSYTPPPASNPYAGYTGPRCYAPGGKSWKPCG